MKNNYIIDFVNLNLNVSGMMTLKEKKIIIFY